MEVPARIIKYRFPEKVIADLQELKWWEYSFTNLKNRSRYACGSICLSASK